MFSGQLWPFRRVNPSWQDARALFILSTGRVGTVSLIELLNLSSSITAHHEPEPNLIHLMPRAFNEMSRRPDHYGRLFTRARARLLAEAADQGRIFAEATLLKHYAPVIAGLMPSARFVCVHRHPGGVVRSTMRRGWYADHPYDRYRPRPGRDMPAHRMWSSWTAFEKNCWLWAAENELFLRLQASLEPGRFMYVPFEELFKPASDCAGRLFDFAGVDRPPASLIRQKLAERHNEQQTGQFPIYERWPLDLLQRLDAIAGPTMTKLGYDRPITDSRFAAAA